ncbi:MAG: hypothetical protein ACLQDY_15625 [Streptosporangiaceae bacterium]
MIEIEHADTGGNRGSRRVLKIILAATSAGVLLGGCGGSARSQVASSPKPTASSATSDVPGSALPGTVACQDFRSATSVMSKEDPTGTNLKLIKAYGKALIRATKPLNVAKPDPDPTLASALGVAGAANLAIAIGYEPDGVAAAYNAATKDVNAVGADCTAMGY